MINLADFIRVNRASILSSWEKFASSIPSARHMEIDARRDHAAGILNFIADDLDLAVQAEGSAGRALRRSFPSEAELHGAARMTAGFSIADTVSEFRALRASVLALWIASNRRAQRISGDLIRFNEAIDQALAESLERYLIDSEIYTRRFDTLLSSSPDLHYLFDGDGRLIYANRALARLCNRPANSIIGRKVADICPVAAGDLQQRLDDVIATGKPFRGEITLRHAPGGKERTYRYLFVPVPGDARGVEAVAGTARNISELKASEENIRRNANYDSLTGLPNRALFRDRLKQELKRSERTGTAIALLFIDLDGFKEVNDRQGHAAGDQLLQLAAHRISACVRDTDTVARIGGDEFTVILTEINRVAHIEILAQQILDELARPFSILFKDVYISCSIGITLHPQDAATPENLLRNADQAMYVAKKAGRNRFSFFTASMRDSAWARLKVIDALRHALPRQQLVVYYQPIVDLTTARVVKAEALLRWRHPQEGLVLPTGFIGLAEETGLISEIGEWVLGEAMVRAHEWSAMLGRAFQISVNKSPVEFMSKTVMKNWEAHLTALGMERNRIVVEITEGILLDDSPGVREKLDKLQRAGVQFAIDDFGIGYSSMAYLKKFKVDILKIDQSFVQDIMTSGDSRIFTETIIMMAHKLGLKVIAEGVETAAQRDWLAQAGCDFGQGFLFSEPLAPAEFNTLLRADDMKH